MPKNEDFATRLRRARENRQLKQADLARRTGLQPSAISQFETGQREPSPENLRKLAAALETSTDYLLTGVPESAFAGPQLRAVVKYAQSMSGDDLDILKDFAELLAKKAKERVKKKKE